MTTDAIFMKYAEALDLGADTRVSGDAVLLALRLAVQDAYAAGGALADDLAAIVASQAQATPDQRQAESAISQIGRLAEWLEEHRPALYHDPDLNTAGAMIRAYNDLLQQLAQMDADNAELVRQLRQARNEADARWFSGDQELSEQLRLAQAEIDRLTRQNVIATDTFNSLAADRTNGAAAVGHVGNVTEPPVDWWADLDEETNDWRISVEAARRTFRQVPKPARLRMAVAVALHIGNGQMPKQADFDARRPAWMSSATAFCSTFGCTWYELPKVLA